MNGVLVTGGLGYIGSHFCFAAEQMGFTPIIIDNARDEAILRKRPGWILENRNLEFCDKYFLRELKEKYNIKTIHHFAAHKDAIESMKNPQKYYDNNVTQGLFFLESAMQAGFKNFVNSSTAAVYGPSEFPSSELSKCAPTNPYGKSKLFFETMMIDICGQNDINYINFRYFNVAGGKIDINYIDSKSDSLIDRCVRSAISEEDFTVFGMRYKTKDGSPVRDFVHVADVADAHLLAGSYLEMGGKSETLNIGTGQGSTVLDVVSMVKTVSSKQFDVTALANRPGDVPMSVATGLKIKHTLGWQPRRDLKTICMDHYDWVTYRPMASE